MNIIELKNVDKVYSPGQKYAYQALQNINLRVKKGEIIAIMGPSGSGKSTLMNIMGLLDRPTAGELMINNEKITLKMSDRKLSKIRNQSVGFIFQTFNLLPKLSVLDNVLLPTIYYNGLKDMRKKAVALLDKVGLDKRIKYKPTELSGGEKQRVAIARALINNPEIILADEPTGNLDSRTGEGILKILQGLNRTGKTVVIITHDEKIARQTDRLIKIMDGKIINA